MDVDILRRAYDEYMLIKPKYDKMLEYYKGNSDAMKNYKLETPRTNNKTPTNFIKNFIDEEVTYSVGNDVVYTSKSGNEEMIEELEYELAGFSGAHDVNLLEKMLTTSIAYELYYVDSRDGNFASKVISSNNGHAILDEFGNVSLFMHIYSKPLDDVNYIDVYDDKYIYHYNDSFEEIEAKDTHPFEEVPVGVATYNIEEDNRHKTIYTTIKGLQDGYETNLSDIVNEITDMRNAYLKLVGIEIDEDDLTNMKKLGIMSIPDSGGDAEWLIKNINDTFIQNTLGTVEDNMYQLTKHINHNEKMQSNVSSLAIRARLMGLEQKCKLNQKAIGDCIDTRVRMIFKFLEVTKNRDYDHRDVRLTFTANLPADDLSTAEMIQKLGDNISIDTALGQLSFIDSPSEEIERIKRERDELYQGKSLLDD